MVDVHFKKKFSHLIPIHVLKQHEELQHMLILRRGNRLSITPVTSEEWNFILSAFEE
jgi:predicted RNA-binding protein with PUA-like domain